MRTAKKHLSKLIEEAEKLEESLEEPENNSDDPKKNKIDNLLSAFPSSEGYYGKLYRQLPTGKLAFVYQISNLEDMEEDPEIVIGNLVREHGWPDGQYQLRVHKKGTPNIYRAVSTIISTPKDQIHSSSQLQTSSQTYPPINTLDQLAEFISKAKDVGLIGGDEKLDAKKMVDVMAEAFNKGIEAIPKPQNDNLISILTILKELGIIEKPKKPSLLEEIQTLKELGIIKDKEEDNTDKMIEKFTTLVAALKPFISPETSTPSIGVEIIRTIGPHVPKIVENITNAVNNIAEVSKMRLSQRIGGNIQLPKAKPKVESEPTLQDYLKQIIATYDTSQYPQLKEVALQVLGEDVCYNILDGTISIDTAIRFLTMWGGEDFSTPQARKYISEFMEWWNKSRVVAKCKICNEQYVYRSMEDFQADEKICDCGGEIEIEEK